MRFSLFLLLLFLSSCAPKIHDQKIFLEYSIGHTEQAEFLLTQKIESELPCHNFQESKDAVWLLLDRAITRFVNQDIEGAILDFKQADEAIDFYNQKLLSDTVFQILGEDSNAPYAGDDFEQALAKLYFALALLHAGDESNAFAILRSAEDAEQKKRLAYQKSPITQNYYIAQNPLAKLLFSALLTKKGDYSNAAILRRQAEVLVRKEIPEIDSEKATLILICHNGNAPQKRTVYSDASKISLLALELLLGVQGVEPAVCNMVGIPVPELSTPVSSFPLECNAYLGAEFLPLNSWYNVGAFAEIELESKMPVILARGAARMLLRREFVHCMNEQEPFLGAITDFGMLVANSMTSADTRSWSMLPMSIDVAYFQAEPQTAALEIETILRGYRFSNDLFNIKLKKGDLCIINIFNIHPGITKILIPNRFICEDNL